MEKRLGKFKNGWENLLFIRGFRTVMCTVLLHQGVPGYTCTCMKSVNRPAAAD